MDEKIMQIIPAPAGLCFGFDGGKAQPVACLALVQLEDGDREIRAMGLVNCEAFFDVVEEGGILFFDT